MVRRKQSKRKLKWRIYGVTGNLLEIIQSQSGEEVREQFGDGVLVGLKMALEELGSVIDMIEGR